MPTKSIEAYVDWASGWALENNDIECRRASPGVDPRGTTGFRVSSGARIVGNKIHHCPGGGYSIYIPSDEVLIEGNEIYNNGTEQKAIDTNTSIHWFHNWFHDNDGDGLWNDGNGPGSVIEYNLAENNGRFGIDWEASVNGTIRYNVVRNNKTGIYIPASKGTDIYENDVFLNSDVSLNTGSGIAYFIDCQTIGLSPWQIDLTNNSIHHNRIKTAAWPVYAVSLSLINFPCDPDGGGPLPTITDADYLNNDKENNSDFNTFYQVVLSGDASWNWFWQGSKDWAAWQAIGHDANSTRSTY